ncbi:MAG: sensor histidine kinase [Anaerolineales bacterium]
MMTDPIALLQRTESLPWRQALDEILLEERNHFIFDNVALYRKWGANLDVEYARAFGRGRASEADAAWGEQVAADVLHQGRRIVITPSSDRSTSNRLEQAYLLASPIVFPMATWALIFARFGGPVFDEVSLEYADKVVWLVQAVLSRRLLLELADEVERLRRQMGMQNDFLSTISHQLRTPLGLIKGYVDTLLRPEVHWEEPEQRKFLAVIEKEADRLTVLVENLLASSAWEYKAVPLNFQILHLESVVRDAALRARHRYPNMKVSLEAAHLPPIWGDAVRLTQVMDNLFNNVAQHAQGAPVTIRLWVEGDYIHLAFRDMGPGMSQDVLAGLFQRFYRPSSTSGSGLGLYICHQIVEAHGGRIWAESEPGHGTTLHLLLPLSRDQGPRHEPLHSHS